MQTGCSQCQAKFLCSKAGEMEETCQVSSSMALKAVRISYVYPLLLFLIILLTLSQTLSSEWWSAGIALGVLALYYFILWLFRRRIEKKYQLKK
jgi:positive regulator of sigma E activity